MRLPAGHVTRLFLGFTCSTMFLVLFAVLVAHNTEAGPSNPTMTVTNEPALTIAIPTAKPVETIHFYNKLGFRTVPGLTGGLDTVSMEKEGTPYKLEICHNRFSESGPVVGGVSGLSFRVSDLSEQMRDLKGKGLSFVETGGNGDVSSCASLKDPNGISIRLFER